MRNAILAAALLCVSIGSRADIECKSWNLATAAAAAAASYAAYSWGYADAAGYYLAVTHRNGNVTVFGDGPRQYNFTSLKAHIDLHCSLQPEEMVSRHIDRLAERLVMEADEPHETE